MGRNLSPKWKREFSNLDKNDTESRKSAMKALKSYVKEMNPSSIPQFLSHVSDSKDSGHRSDNYTISLYEVLARVHGPNIVPQIEIIMSAILETLSSSSASSLHQACSRVVISLARYSINPNTPSEKKRSIIDSICKPLSESLLGSQESLSSGSALCLTALVDSDNWRFSSNEMVNEVCLRATGSLEEKPKQTNSHISLVMSLAKRNPLIVEAYARLLIRSGLRILDMGVVEGNSQKRLSAIQMVNFLMKWLDPQSVCSEVGLVVREMDKCSSDRMAFVKGAAFEALQTAKGILKGSCSGTGGSGSRRMWLPEEELFPASPESRTTGSFVQYESAALSPIFRRKISCEFDECGDGECGGWMLENNGGVDVSLKDGLLSVMGDPTWKQAGSEGREGGKMEDSFAGFMERYSDNVTPQINVEDMIFKTPRKLLRSLQDEEDFGPHLPEEQQGFDHPPPSWYESSPDESENADKESPSPVVDSGLKCSAESVSSTDNAIGRDSGPTAEAGPANLTQTGHRICWMRGAGLGLVWGAGFAVFTTALASLIWMGSDEEMVPPLVPT